MMASRADVIRNDIRETELNIDTMRAQVAAMRRDLDRLAEARSGIQGQRALFFEDLARRRKLAGNAMSLENVASAQRFGAKMSEEFGSSFEAGVDGEFAGLVRDIDATARNLQDSIADAESSIRAAETRLDRLHSDLRVEQAREQARRESEGRGA